MLKEKLYQQNNLLRNLCKYLQIIYFSLINNDTEEIQFSFRSY